MLDALRTHDAPPLRRDLLAAGGAMIDLPPLRRRPAWPDRAMAWVWRGFWLLFAALLALAISGIDP